MRKFFSTLIISTMLCAPAMADELIGSYSAYIGEDDLYNSSGERLTQPWQVLRQDRANFHKYGVSQPGDEDDAFFSSAKNRAIMEQMVLHGRIERAAARSLLRGDVSVSVDIYGRGNVGTSIDVTVTGN